MRWSSQQSLVLLARVWSLVYGQGGQDTQELVDQLPP
jgi:hypothetical protein